MKLKRETLKIKPEVLQDSYYEGVVGNVNSIDGKAGKFQRHALIHAVHGKFNVITEATADVIPFDAKVRIVDPLFYPDRGLHGRGVTPAMNVLAKKIEVVKEGN